MMNKTVLKEGWGHGMDDLAHLQSRLMAALDRINAGTDALPEADGGAKTSDAGSADLRLVELEAQLAEMTYANEALIEANDKLRTALGAGEGYLASINPSVMAELQALRAERATDRAELRGILQDLDAIMGDGQ